MRAEDMAWRPVVAAMNAVERVALRHQVLYKLLLVDALEPLRWGISRHRAAERRASSQEAGSRLPRPLPAESA